MKRSFLLIFAFLALNTFSGIAGKQQQAAKNIVLILADDMGFHMSCTGTPGIQTPHLDRLAEKGTLLTNAFSVCSSCSPSRSSILTGMYPHANGHWRNTFGPTLSDPEKEFSRGSEKADIVGVHEWIQTLPEIMNDELVSLIDLLPTLFEYAGIPVPAQVQGKSLLPLVRDGKRELEGRDYIFVEHNSHGPAWAEFYPSRAVFNGKYYLIRNLMPGKSYKLPDDLYQGGKPWGNLSYPAIVDNREKVPRFYQAIVTLEENRPPWELYELQSDPGQMENLFGLPAYEATRKNLQQVLENWQEQTGDTVLNEMIRTFKNFP